jgi:hypothetical protein
MTAAMAFAAMGARSAPVDEAVLAAMSVASARNYSWTVIISNDADQASSVIRGRTAPGGFSQITDTTPSEYLRMRLPGVIPNPLEMVMRSGRILLQTAQGWRFPGELEEQIPEPSRSRRGRANALPGADVPLTYAIRQPHEDLQILVGSGVNLRASGDTFVGELLATGAAQFLNYFGQPQAQVVRAAGAFQCWVQDGHVVRYEVRVNGAVRLGDSRDERSVRWSIVAELRDFGTTTVNVPRAVQIMLGG